MLHDEKYLEDTSLFWELLAHDPRKTDEEACGGTKYKFANWIKFSRNGVVLDAGCGYGRFTIPLASKCELVVALDLSPSMLKRLKANIQRYGLTNIDLIRADLRYLPFTSKRFDGIICWSTIYYIPKRYWKSIIEIFRRSCL